MEKLDSCMYLVIITNKFIFGWHFSSENMTGRHLNDVVKHEEKGVKKIDYVGLATDYCLKYTALDSVSEGFQTRVLVNCIKGIEAKGCERALKDMKSKGIELV